LLGGDEQVSTPLQVALNVHCERVRAPEHTPRGLFRLLERRYGLAEIVERGACVPGVRQRINPGKKK